MSRFATIAITILFALSLAASVQAQPPKWTPTLRKEAIESVLRCLTEGYVFPEVAKKMEDDVRARMEKSEYNAIEDGNALAERLTRDLRAVSHDQHIRVEYSPAVLPQEPNSPLQTTPEMFEEMRTRLAQINFGLTKKAVLAGNIGYLNFTLLAPPEVAATTYIAAMNMIGDTDALIIDLRECGGSISPDAIPMLCSYFFERPVHLNDIYWRNDNSTRQFWTYAYVPGKRYGNKPIYVLTSGRTFSGAEELAYDLKNLKRATLIGETTGGGANPGGTRRAHDHFTVWVPFGRAINPITKTNWEGTGVSPDIPVSPIKALDTAQKEALEHLKKSATDESRKQELSREITKLEKSLKRFRRVTFALKGFAEAKQVMVAGAFNYWSPRANPLQRKGDTWEVELEMEPGRHLYKFIVDDRWILDPDNRSTEKDGEYVNSVRVIE